MKNINIFECRECPYNEITICRHPSFDVPKKFEDKDHYVYFPIWCPLRDVNCCFNSSGFCFHPNFEDNCPSGVEIPDCGAEYRPGWCPLEDV